MKVRTAQFVMVPMWVVEHPDVKGNGTRLAVYVGLRAVAWENPDKSWRSIRALAVAVGDVVGLTEEGCRSHLTALLKIGAAVRDGDLFLPSDEPEMGLRTGAATPSSGAATPESEMTPLLTRDREKDSPTESRVGLGETRHRKARDVIDAWWKWYRETSGHAPMSNYHAAINVVVKALEAGYEVTEIKRALASLDTSTLSTHALERALTRHRVDNASAARAGARLNELRDA